jgi:hypothetical protein
LRHFITSSEPGAGINKFHRFSNVRNNMSFKRILFGAALAGLAGLGCTVDHSSDETTGYFFTGTVYDGLEGKPLNASFEVRLIQGASTEEVKVKAKSGGKFAIGPVKPGSDYIIEIESEDYREFFAAEPLKTTLPSNDEQQTSQYYEAYLFPKSLQSPPVTLAIFGEDSTSPRPSGSIRFAPTGMGTSALDLGADFAPAIPGHLWTNDADLKSGTKILGLAEGVVNIEAGALVYGVTYEATVYDVSGNAYQAFNFTAGLTGHQTITLSDLADDVLKVTSSSLDTGNFSSDGAVTFTFNFPVELSPSTPLDYVAELIDDGIEIPETDDDGDGVSNALIATDSPATRERSTKVEISGNTLKISWPGHNQAGAFEPNAFDVDDLWDVTYPTIGILLRRTGSTDTDARALSTMLGERGGVGTSVTVNLKSPLP